MTVKRSITELSDQEIDDLSDFQADTLARLLDWARENSINRDELVKLFVTGMRMFSNLIKFEI